MVKLEVLVVLAMDASGSLSDRRLMLQREGHARALSSPEVLDALAPAQHGGAAFTALEWSSQDRQDQLVPWTIIRDRADAERFGTALMAAPRPMPGYTSISGALDASLRLLREAPHEATRRVIDISGNGRNNDGRPLAEARDGVLAAGATINGLAILDAVPRLDAYFAEQVIGGPGAFLLVARDMESFAAAIRRKLLAEIAAVPPGSLGPGRIREVRRPQAPLSDQADLRVVL